MRETPMSAARRRAMGRGNQMGKNFLRSLDAGLLMDRTTIRPDGKRCKRVALPSGLRTMARPTESQP